MAHPITPGAAPEPTVRPGWHSHVLLAAILVLAGLLRLLWLSQNGYGRLYYAAGVRSMLDSWHNFFFNAFDPAGFLSLDKPPVALWLQAAAAKLIGFGPLAMLLPQALEGLVAIVLVYLLVRRAFGDLAGLLAALFLALTPISVAVDRSNNVDSCLVMVLLLAAWALMRAVESGRARHLILAMALVGVGFNVKMGAALILAPALALTYFVAAPAAGPLRRVAHLALAGFALVAVALSWMAVYDSVPPGSRPYVGSTRGNSMLELALVHNGLDRFAARGPAQMNAIDSDGLSGAAGARIEPAARPRLWDETPVGFVRLLHPHQAAQTSWLLPLALAGLVIGALAWRRGWRRLQRASLLLWGGWLASYWVVFSSAGGVFHTYYLAALAPPLSALAAIGLAQLWASHRRARPLLLPAALAGTALWQAYIGAPLIGWTAAQWDVGLYLISIAAALAASALLLAAALPRARLVSMAGLMALLAMPAAWSLSVVWVRPNVATPSADIGAFARTGVVAAPPARRGRGAEIRRDKLISFLRPRHGGERFLVAVPNALVAAPIIVGTGLPVLALGGYTGKDPILAPGDLQKLVEGGQLRFVMIGGFSLAPAEQDAHQEALAKWVRANGRPVDPALWQLPLRTAPNRKVPLGGGFVTMTAPELYDLRARPGSS